MSLVLLLFSAISLLVGPVVNSQTFTTITTWSTVTSQLTSTRYSSYPVGTTTIVASMVTKTSFPATRFTLEGMASGRISSSEYRYYDGFEGERLQGKWESNYPINFYIKIVGLTSETLTAQDSTSYSIDWTFPKSGQVVFVFENRPTLSDSSKERTVTLTVYKVGAQSTTSIVYSTTSTIIVHSVTQTFSSVFVSQVSQSWNNLFGGLLTVVVIVVLVFVVYWRRRCARVTDMQRKALHQPLWGSRVS